MKALCVQSPNNIIIEERPMPVINCSTDVLVKVQARGYADRMYIFITVLHL
jgi:threonine dehydrogenase-like Zn-dependent dehydrogenase